MSAFPPVGAIAEELSTGMLVGGPSRVRTRPAACHQRRAHVRAQLRDRDAVQVDDYEFLRDASPTQRARRIVDDKGAVLFWPELREGISVAGLLGLSETELEQFAGLY